MGQFVSMNYVYFDLETQKSAQDVGGWKNIEMMRMSLGVTYSTARGGYRIYPEDEVNDLIRELQRADCVVGYNILRFDYTVLQAYSVFDFSQVPSLDLLVDLEKVLGHRIKLDDVAEASLGVGKIADGVDALKWWKEGKVMEIAEYCCFDVKTTWLVHEFGARNGRVLCTDKVTKLKKEIPVEWKVD